MVTELAVSVRLESDIVRARQEGKALTASLGFSGSELIFIATAISEVARNIVRYAQRGEIAFQSLEDGGRRAIVVIASDRGPGIADVTQAMQDGYSSSHSLGLGLPGARRLMDEFDIQSAPGVGTTVTMRKWTA